MMPRGTGGPGHPRLLAAVVLIPLLSGAALADTPAGPAFEAARIQARGGEPAALRDMADRLDDLVPGDDFDGTTAALLRGSILHEAGRHQEALREFRAGAEASATDGLRESARFLAGQAWEAMGRDDEAEPIWSGWSERHPGGRLSFAAGLRHAWLKLRRDEPAAADSLLSLLADRHAWLADRDDYAFCRAATDLQLGDAAAALARLPEDPAEPGPLYLRGLCLAAADHHLDAAAAWQRLAARHPRSVLREPALFAKANMFLASGAYRSAAEEFAALAADAVDPALRAESDLRAAAATFLAGDLASAAEGLRAVTIRHEGTDIAARAQFLLGEVMVEAGDLPAAIREYNAVLTSYFDESIAASAQYRVARCFAAQGRTGDATAAYMAVVAGYPLEPEAPAAAYLAGTALLDAGRPRDAAPYFQIVLDRYAARRDGDGIVVFAEPRHQELVEAALCMLEISWHRAGDLGQLAGAPHVLLHSTPPSSSDWRAWALLVDADAMAAQGHHEEARASLERLDAEFSRHPARNAARQLLAWTHAQQGDRDQAVAVAEDLLARDTGEGDPGQVNHALLNVGHVRFNQGRYREASGAYEQFLHRNPEHDERALVLYQLGLCYLRLDRAGDAVDRWEEVVSVSPADPLAEKAWARAGDVYFQAGDYDQAKRCYAGLLEHFGTGDAAAMGQLRMAQCDFNAGRDAAALQGYAVVTRRYPDSPLRADAEHGLEQTLYRMGQSADGTAELARLVEMFPDSPYAADAQFQIASRLYEAGEYPAAADEFRRVVSRFPDYSGADRAQYLMGEAYTEAGQADDAARAYEQFLGFFGDSELRTAVRFRLGMNRFAAGRYADAATDFVAVVDADAAGDMGRASLYNLALCLRLEDDLTGAAAHLDRYRREHPGDEREAAVHFQLGDIHEREGDLAAAEAAFATAATSKTGGDLKGEILYRLGAVREKTGNTKGALAAFTAASRTGAAGDSFRLSALARSAVLHEQAEDYEAALAVYRDLMKNARDPQLAAAATDRARELAAALE